MKAMLIAQNPGLSKTLTLQGVFYSQYFRNKAIVLCKTTNEYCQTLPDCEVENPFAGTVGKVAGFSLHAGVATKANERAKLERLCRYITRPVISTKRLSMTRNGQVRYELKTPWRNRTWNDIWRLLTSPD